MPRTLLGVYLVLTCWPLLHAQVPSDATPGVLSDISGVVKAGTKI